MKNRCFFRQALVAHGLPAPGDRSLLKAQTINADDRAKGSNVVDITWPAG